MAERIADGAEPAVDELRRKARCRLVGAIVLALAAAIIVPMLLENEPRPLGDDVSVQIPSKEEGRFVNRLTGTTPDAKPAVPKAVQRVRCRSASTRAGGVACRDACHCREFLPNSSKHLPQGPDDPNQLPYRLMITEVSPVEIFHASGA